MVTANLELPEISEGQANKFQTHNNALDLLDEIIAGSLAHDMTSDADYTLSTATNPEEWQYFWIVITDVVGYGFYVIRGLNQGKKENDEYSKHYQWF